MWEGWPEAGSLASGVTEQLVETQQSKTLLSALPELQALASFPFSFTACLCPSLFFLYSSPPLSPTSQRVVKAPPTAPHGSSVFFPVSMVTGICLWRQQSTHPVYLLLTQRVVV